MKKLKYIALIMTALFVLEGCSSENADTAQTGAIGTAASGNNAVVVSGNMGVSGNSAGYMIGEDMMLSYDEDGIAVVTNLADKLNYDTAYDRYDNYIGEENAKIISSTTYEVQVKTEGYEQLNNALAGIFEERKQYNDELLKEYSTAFEGYEADFSGGMSDTLYYCDDRVIVTRADEHVFSVVYYSIKSFNGVNGIVTTDTATTYVLDSATGDRLYFYDIVGDMSKFKNALLLQINQSIEFRMTVPIAEYLDDFCDNPDASKDVSYYLTDDGLMISFNQHIVSDVGCPSILVPYSKNLGLFNH